MGLFKTASFQLACVGALSAVVGGYADAAEPVQIQILVVEARRGDKGSFDAGLSAKSVIKPLKRSGFKSAKILDRINTPVEPEASISLEVKATKKGPKRMLKVTVLKSSKEGIHLRVAMPSLGLNTVTKHPNGGTLLVAVPRKDQATTFLAVTPRR